MVTCFLYFSNSKYCAFAEKLQKQNTMRLVNLKIMNKGFKYFINKVFQLVIKVTNFAVTYLQAFEIKIDPTVTDLLNIN